MANWDLLSGLLGLIWLWNGFLAAAAGLPVWMMDMCTKTRTWSHDLHYPFHFKKTKKTNKHKRWVWVWCQYLGNDAAKLRSVLGKGQKVVDGAADGVDTVRGIDLFDQDLKGGRNPQWNQLINPAEEFLK